MGETAQEELPLDKREDLEGFDDLTGPIPVSGDTYYKLTDPEILAILVKYPELKHWHPWISHIPSTSYLSEERQVLKIDAEIRALEWDDVNTIGVGDPQLIKAIKSLAHYAYVRNCLDPFHGHRSRYTITSRRDVTYEEVQSRQKRRGLLW